MEIRKNINRSLPLQIIIQKINYHLIKENNSLAFWENIYIYIHWTNLFKFRWFLFSSIEIIHRISKRKNRVSNRNEMESNKCSKFSNAVKRSRVLTISFFFRKKKKDILSRFPWMRISFLDNEPICSKKKKKEKFRRIVFVMAREVESGSRKKDLPQGLVRRAAKRLVWERWNNVHFSL